jgi:tRNA(fMet)-specific endonuclease VapC
LILLDTNVVIHFLKGEPGISTRIRSTDRSELALPAIVVYELEYGTLRSGMSARRRHRIDLGLGQIETVPFDAAAAAAVAKIRMFLEKQGALIGPMDLMIAGTALSRAALLVTNNTAEFSRVPGLRTEDWRTA